MIISRPTDPVPTEAQRLEAWRAKWRQHQFAIAIRSFTGLTTTANLVRALLNRSRANSTAPRRK